MNMNFLYSYFLYDKRGAFISTNFVNSCSDLVYVLLTLRRDFPRLSYSLQDLSSLIELIDFENSIDVSEVFSNDDLVLEVIKFKYQPFGLDK